jgi:hypothetical protein
LVRNIHIDHFGNAVANLGSDTLRIRSLWEFRVNGHDVAMVLVGI